MQFLYPYFLFGLLAISIPILIHLFNFRRFKKVLFTNVRFLKEVKQQSQKQRNLKHLLVLAARILAITMLVFAFAQPYIPNGSKKTETGQKAVSIYIDNSFSMNAVSDKGMLLEIAKSKAREIVSAYGTGDKFQLLTNSFSGTHDRFYSKEEFNQKLDEVDIAPETKSLKDITQKQGNFLSSAAYKFKKAYIISDFQKSFTGSDPLKPQPGIDFFMVPLKSNTEHNLFIDSVWFDSPVFQPNQPLSLVVRIKNSGEESLEGGTMNLKLNGIQKSIAGFDIAAGESKNVPMSFSVGAPGWQNAELSLTDHPIVFDDNYHFTFKISDKIKVLALNQGEANPFIAKLFATESFFEVNHINSNQVDYSILNEYDLIVLSALTSVSGGMSQELTNYLDNGGNVVLFPGEIAGKSGIDDFMKAMGCSSFGNIKTSETEVGSIDFQNELFRNIIDNQHQNLDYPKVHKYYSLPPDNAVPAIGLIKLRNGDQFLKVYNKGKGHVYQFAVNLGNEWSNFQQNQLIVPVMFRMALLKTSEIPLAYTIGSGVLIKPVSVVKNSRKPNVLTKGKFEIMAEKIARNNVIFLTDNHQIKDAGIYQLLDADDRKPIQSIAFNFNRIESEMEMNSPTEIQEKFSAEGIKVYDHTDLPLNSLIKQEENGKPLWRLFIILALLFIAIEVILLRFWKNTPKPNPALS